MATKPQADPALTKLASTIDAKVVLSPPKTKKDMEAQALSVALSKGFLDRVDEEVGTPIDGETRDDYVERAKGKIVELLIAMLG